MAQSTLQRMARELQAYCPSVPYNLAQSWIIDRYRSITENLLWSFKIGEGTFFTPTAYSTGTVTMTNDSTGVVGSGTAFTAAMIGRQLVVGGFVFTITAVGSGTSLTIGKKWYGATTAGLAYSIRQAYITPSDTDFHAFISVIDPAQSWRIHTGHTSFELDIIDTRRSSSGTPTLLASRSYNTSGIPTFELWPHSTSQRQYMYMYEKRIADLALPTDTPQLPIRSDILVAGALADLSRWPGTREDPNPFYDPYFNQFKSREAEFQMEVDKVLVADQNIYMTDLTYYTSLPYAPLDSAFRQNHAF